MPAEMLNACRTGPDGKGCGGPLHAAARLTLDCGGARIDPNCDTPSRTGAHKMNNVLGQSLIAAAR